jgi:hypothetical protein
MQTTAGETRGLASGMVDDGGVGGRGTANEGFGEEKTWHALFDRFTDYGDYSMVSSKWAFRAPL